MFCPESSISIIIESVYAMKFEMPSLHHSTNLSKLISPKSTAVSDSMLTHLKKQTVKLWGQIINIYQGPFLHNFSIKAGNAFSKICSSRNINLSGTQPLRPIDDG